MTELNNYVCDWGDGSRYCISW